MAVAARVTNRGRIEFGQSGEHPTGRYSLSRTQSLGSAIAKLDIIYIYIK